MPSKLKRYTVLMGSFKGKEVTLTKKKTDEGFIIVNVVDGPLIRISKLFLR